MAVQVKRLRDGNGDITTLNLAAAAAASRRFEVALGSDGADSAGVRLTKFIAKKSTAESTSLTVYLVDTENGNETYELEALPATTATNIVWYPDEEEQAGYDVQSPDTSGWTYRFEFSQAGGACAADVAAFFKGV